MARREARLKLAWQLRDAAIACARAAEEPAREGGVDAAAFGYLVAVCYGDTDSADELLAECEALGIVLPADAHLPRNLDATCRAVIG